MAENCFIKKKRNALENAETEKFAQHLDAASESMVDLVNKKV
jgi:hypothetical protein